MAIALLATLLLVDFGFRRILVSIEHRVRGSGFRVWGEG